MRNPFIVFIILAALISACKTDTRQSRGAIVLGDSAFIVTETNPQYLEDFVTDVRLQSEMPAESPEPKADTVAIAEEKPVDTVKQVQKPVEQPATAKGLTIEFKEITVFIPGIEVKSFRNQNLKTLNGVSYQLSAGSLPGNQLVLKGANVQRVQQRYITTLVVNKEGKKMELNNMDMTTGWTGLKGSKNSFNVTGLEQKNLGYVKTNVANVRNAISRTARSNRYGKSELREWESLAKTVKAVNQTPVSVVLQSVMWRIEGKDSKGKPFNKEVRIDMPI